MYFKIDPSGGVPIYLQIVSQIKTDIALGRLRPEDPLPSVRQLAVDLSINPNTVARAYLDLEHEGILYKRHGQGTYVASTGAEVSKRDRRKRIQGLLQEAVVQGIHLGMDQSELQETWNSVIDRIVHPREKRSGGNR